MEVAITNHQAKYYAYALTREGGHGVERLQQSLLNAAVDLNPHQVEAALFALHSPLSKGCILADEVGLGKTIEAGLILCQLWAERKRRLLVVCPAALRRQWQSELAEKFNLPSEIIDAKRARELRREGKDNPFERPAVAIASYNYAAKESDKVRVVQWDFVVMDEAHKLRNSHQASNRIGSALRFALKDRRKALLTATPIQNSLTELYGVSTMIDEDLFGDLPSFRARYVNQGGDHEALRNRLRDFCRRTLRKDVQEYVRYTERHALTERFEGSNSEQKLYDDVSAYLQDDTTYAFPSKQRGMLVQLVRKLLASSPAALEGTLQKIKVRLDRLTPGSLLLSGEETDDIIGEDEEELVDAAVEDQDDATTDDDDNATNVQPSVEDNAEENIVVDASKLEAEKNLVSGFIVRAQAIGTDSKTRKLLETLSTAFPRLEAMGAARKAVVFTESVRSMMFLKRFLEANGYGGKVLTFSGGGRRDPGTEAIYRAYKDAHPGDTSSRDVMLRQAVVEKFRDEAEILLATEAGAEGINLQFCSLVVNYDLPWNPQRVEQRIGRCHRYGQKYDVTVVNFLNTRNAADVRIFDLLNDKFRLFDGLFGASDDVLGITDSHGVPFERRVNDILQKCRTPDEINAAFDALRDELSEEIARRMEATREAVLDNLDASVAGLLRDSQQKTALVLDEASRQFWALTKHMLQNHARDFDDETLSFNLTLSPEPSIPTGIHTFSKTPDAKGVPYRPNSPLGEWVIAAAKALPTPLSEVCFDLTGNRMNYYNLETIKGKAGFLALEWLRAEAIDASDFLLFTIKPEEGDNLESKDAEDMFKLDGVATEDSALTTSDATTLAADMDMLAQKTLFEAQEHDNALFKEDLARLNKRADDLVCVAERKLELAKNALREARRAVDLAPNQAELLARQAEADRLEAAKDRARRAIDDVEDKAEEERRRLVAALKRRLVQSVSRTTLFTIKWKVV